MFGRRLDPPEMPVELVAEGGETLMTWQAVAALQAMAVDAPDAPYWTERFGPLMVEMGLLSSDYAPTPRGNRLLSGARQWWAALERMRARPRRRR